MGYHADTLGTVIRSEDQGSEMGKLNTYSPNTIVEQNKEN